MGTHICSTCFCVSGVCIQRPGRLPIVALPRCSPLFAAEDVEFEEEEGANVGFEEEEVAVRAVPVVVVVVEEG